MKKYFLFFSLVAALSAFSSCGPGKNSMMQSDQKFDSTQGQSQPQAKAEDAYHAPELNLPNRDGDSISLKSLRGNIVLVDFWASWCPPCRRENPKIAAMYNRVKDKKLPNGGKFIIYSVSLDDNKLAWEDAIKKDRLNWPNHVSDLRGWQSVAAATYGVDAIPTNVLVDTSGVVVGKELSTPEIELFLKERLK
jgi:thiol-disulfide isomerase/thioredoxin